MQMIAHNPLLETLVLHCYSYGYFLAISAESLQTFLRDAQTSLTEMFLPHLDTLTIHGTHAFVSTFSEHLNIPEDIPNVDIRVQVESAPIDAVVDPAITAFSLPRPLRPMLHRMTDIKLVGIFGSRAQISSPRPPRPTRPADPHRELTLSLEGYPPYPSTTSPHTNTLQTNLSRLALMLAPVAVRKLAINVSLARQCRHYGGVAHAPSESASNAFWAALLDCFPSVEELCILVPPAGLNAVGVDLLSVLHALRPQPLLSHTQQPGVDDQKAEGAGQGELELPRCPLLTRLSIHGQIGVDAGEMEEALGPLVDCVVDRARASARLGLLDLHFWYSKQSEMEPLGEARRATLERAKDSVGYFQCRFGRSASCRGCR
ncbi:hypothetical protein C2E23DRAFT_885828 [Lenzites betulinus]|nr:hypothetical protein C2E23DRAFT_885828 [Lenzites betulinus]